MRLQHVFESFQELILLLGRLLLECPGEVDIQDHGIVNELVWLLGEARPHQSVTAHTDGWTGHKYREVVGGLGDGGDGLFECYAFSRHGRGVYLADW